VNSTTAPAIGFGMLMTHTARKKRDQVLCIHNLDKFKRIVVFFFGKHHRESNVKLPTQLFASPN